MKFKEIETKYKADDIPLKTFRTLALALKPTESISVGSHDHYYTRPDGQALRYREGTKPELTIKEKSVEQNNFVRTEVNLPISPDSNLETVEAFAKLAGYQHNFTIYKSCEIHFWSRHNVVYYTVHDKEKSPESRVCFIEIELKEDVPWDSIEQAWEYLRDIEKAFAPIGLTPQRRVRRSLFEMFKRE